MKRTKKSLLTSSIAFVLFLSMFIGTTFAWFTDTAVSEGNVIQSGNLDIDLMKGTKTATQWVWESTDGRAIFEYENWEPGYTTTAVLAVQNNGNLSARWQAKVRLNGTPTILADVIDVYVTSYHNESSVRPDFNDGTWEKLGSVSDILNNDGMLLEGGIIEPGHRQPILVALHMREDAGNEYQGMDLGANFDIVVIATQAPSESDSFDNTYDDNAVADFFPGFQGGSAIVGVTTDDQGVTTEVVTMNGGDASAVIPAGVQMADGATALKLNVSLKGNSDANVQLGESEKMQSLDVHIDGVAAGNTTPMLITLEGYLTPGINTGALKMYHVENGATVVMTQVANPTNHNEFSYDPASGDVTLALASFSEVAVVADTNNPWDGETVNYLWYNASATELTIYNADQLAAFGAIVDGKAESIGIAQDNFAGKTVKLANNIYLSNQLFDPIGWGYVNTGWNRDKVDGKVFQGTFDGNGKTIFDLYQSGWDLEETNGTDYTYTNCGFGLFAAASNATFKDLTINGAYVRVECVEAGVLVGLSQNNCTYQNIGIHNAKIANYQRPAGGLIGEVSGNGTTTIENVTIGSDVVVGSLWGDFDAPCGGVIGARWDDVGKNPQIVMDTVEVGARMDVYSDVTSAYQWYAYRRAGMLIGNTELSATNNQHLAAAPFLTCENVKVYYGDWAAYHYCQFTNQDNSWCNNYPWVRVEEGENCSPYSNPRYGQPVIGGVTVSTDNHTCTGEHLMELRFNQLYGGGQGVYGQAAHDGVEVINYRYSITYINDYQVLAIKYVTEDGAVSSANNAAQDLVKKWADANIGVGKYAFGGWMNAGSTKVETISADNTKNIVLYPYFNKPYTARFVDQQGNVVAWCLFHAEDLTKLEATRIAAEAALPDPGELFELDYWEVNANGNKVQYSENNFKNYTYDVTIYPVYKYTGNLKLTPVDEDSDGTIDYYKVEAIDTLDKTTIIPGYVNGVPVKLVEKLYENDNSWDYGSGVETVIIQEGVQELARNSLGYTQDLSLVKLPSTLTKLGKNTFSRNLWYNVFGDKDTKVLTIEYNGTKADWDKVVANSDGEWANGLKKGTTVKCLDGTYTVTSVNLETSNHKWSWTPN